jgi:Fe-S cluster assembly protein SufD
LTTAVENLEAYIEAFAEFVKEAPGNDLPWLRQLRADAFGIFCNTGFPTTHTEDWRFTNVSGIARTRFSLAPNTSPLLTKRDLSPWSLEGGAARLVFIDGRLVRQLSSIGSLPSGVVVSSLKDEIAKHLGTVEEHLGRYLDTRRDPFCALNTAFFEDGAFVYIPRGLSLEQPIHLLFLASEGEDARMLHPRNLLIVGHEAQATIVEEYESTGGTVLSNSATELIAEESSAVSHYLVEHEPLEAFNISTLRIQQDRSANVASHSVLLGGGLVRNNVHPVLAGEGGECLINGLFVGNGTQHLDNFMYVEHASPHSSSRQFYNGILDDHAHGVFHGRIVVHKNAQKTDAKQTNRNLLLSDDAQIDTKPQLEIYADDVKCTHGATIGQIEEAALFYLRSRGIDEISARRLLLSAFAHECVSRMHPGEARTYCERLIDAHLSSMGQTSLTVPDEGQEQLERTFEEVG